MAIVRYINNPIITRHDVKPSRNDFEVIGVFNPGAVMFDGEYILLLRVAEKPVNDDPSYHVVCYYDEAKNNIEFIRIKKDHNKVYDPRVINHENGNYLTSISHFRIARSKDGYNFTIDDKPTIKPSNIYEAYGIEDARITEIDGVYYINYCSASSLGITTSLALTKDFINFKKEGIIFCPDNKDVAIFPEKINGKYYALHRPSCSNFGKPEMWIAESPDLLCWGNHRKLAGLRDNSWDSGRIGAGAVPFRTLYGWVEIYHGATVDDRYYLGVMLLDLNKPWVVLARSETPLVTPEAPYESEGFLGNVVFSCGVVAEGENIKLYYGAADESVACIDLKLSDILENINISV
ncbi:MAG: glycosidase [Clostridiaceae bacterium]|nr:glycosidase [Clostridiaceae bacterium]